MSRNPLETVLYINVEKLTLDTCMLYTLPTGWALYHLCDSKHRLTFVLFVSSTLQDLFPSYWLTFTSNFCDTCICHRFEPHHFTTKNISLCKKATIHQVTTMLTTSKNVQFPGHNHLLTTGTDDPSL